MSVITTTQPITETWSGSSNITKTWTDLGRQGFYIKNDGASDLTFTVNGMTFTVKAGEVFDNNFITFTTLTITTTVAYRAFVRG